MTKHEGWRVTRDERGELFHAPSGQTYRRVGPNAQADLEVNDFRTASLPALRLRLVDTAKESRNDERKERKEQRRQNQKRKTRRLKNEAPQEPGDSPDGYEKALRREVASHENSGA